MSPAEVLQVRRTQQAQQRDLERRAAEEEAEKQQRDRLCLEQDALAVNLARNEERDRRARREQDAYANHGMAAEQSQRRRYERRLFTTNVPDETFFGQFNKSTR